MSAVPLRGDHWDTLADFTVRKGDRVSFVMSWAPSHDPEMPHVDAEQALSATTDFWTEWSAHAAYQTGPYSDAVDRSIITLKALTYEPTGGIVAAATTSLPEETRRRPQLGLPLLLASRRHLRAAGAARGRFQTRSRRVA